MNSPSGTKPGDVLVKKPRVSETPPTEFVVSERRIRARTFSSPMLLIIIFIVLISIGTLCLMAPFAHYEDSFGGFLVALFTATSAVTVTGLVVVETSSNWTMGGQLVIMVLMFVGGLGFMALAAFLLTILGQRISMAQSLLIRETFSRDQLGGLQRLSVAIVITAVSIQIFGFLAFFSRFIFIYEPGEALWQSLFLAVSGFNNAGIFIFPEKAGLLAHQGDFVLLAILGILILLGTLSFWVVSDLVLKRKFRLYTLVTKIVIIMTVSLIILAGIFIFVSEGSNELTLGSLSTPHKIAISLFEGISGRTAGFTTINYEFARPATDLFMSLMMFVGGATASVAGGIKVTTFFIILMSIYILIRERTYLTVFDREIDELTIRRSYAILVISTGFVFLCTLGLAITNSGILLRDILFESFSAFGTVGLSTGITDQLTPIGQLIVILTMLIGRVGPLIIGLKMVPNRDVNNYRNAVEPVTIG
ncbi:uncharacterized protein METZ01_LOCUS155375 [marine metagenome]|uniref:Trk family potassium uptake protein n=1 Tax=marine metagenome TaxID=408172 RepID=A0A382AMM7_9ZZZZ